MWLNNQEIVLRQMKLKILTRLSSIIFFGFCSQTDPALFTNMSILLNSFKTYSKTPEKKEKTSLCFIFFLQLILVQIHNEFNRTSVEYRYIRWVTIWYPMKSYSSSFRKEMHLFITSNLKNYNNMLIFLNNQVQQNQIA